MEIKQAVEYAIDAYTNAIAYNGELLDYLYEQSLNKGVCYLLNGIIDSNSRKKIRDLGFNVIRESFEITEKYASMQPDTNVYWFWIEPYECETEDDMRTCLEARKIVLEEILKTL